MSYPIFCEKVSLTHKSGTKAYHVMRLVAHDGKSLVVYRWGKAGQFGQVKVETFDNGSRAEKAALRKIAEKHSNGYVNTTSREDTVSDETSLRTFITTPVLMAIGKSNMLHLHAEFDAGALKDAVKVVEYDEDGRKLDVTRRAAFDADQLAETKRLAEAKRQAEQDAKHAAYSAIPGFGRF